ncbi:right-handed parallel beta-helix repeat-containing protein [Cerasicoccus fimbriatus]|uniref:right-handed parallel beta-helix repeat-containing protein n=1 Tax=Cerasicoccus fimbriatus TaxID=3014554 RepID=UPI0022B5D81D|nr:right-handed parallel beta-helix repeat-containing protein [Cerasicoccus sp. TK19100]
MKRSPLPLLGLLLALSTNTFAANYYIDYTGGSDTADGTSPQSAWKHSPGDKNATGNPKAAELKPGDIVTFKGGVQYQGEIYFRDLKGAEGQPIVFDGNSAGNYGEGPAILDGATMITGWKKVTSADQVDGNPKWRDIMFADVDMDLTSNFTQDKFILHRDGNPARQAPWQRLFLIDGEKRVLPIAQMPKPSDEFFPDMPHDFYSSPIALSDSYPHKIYYPEGSKGNRSLPIIGITNNGAAPVIEPFNGGEVALDLAQPETIAEIGVKLHRPKSNEPPESVAFYADGKEVYVAKIDPEKSDMQRFKLDKNITANQITFQLRAPGTDKKWTKLEQLAAYSPQGVNIVEHDVTSVIEDPERLTQKDADWYNGMFVGVHGGNNHVYFAPARRFDPDSHRLYVPHFTSTTYKTTQYAFFNSPKFISLPGEWALEPADGGKTRIFLLPETLENGQPINIGYPVLTTALSINSASEHIEVRGFLMQRYAGGKGGVAVNGSGDARPSHIRIADCEVRFMSGQSGISLNHSDNVTVENCYVHHCPGWTVGIYVNRITGYKLLNTRVDYNSGSGIRHYEAKQGVLKNNVVLNHYGMHSSGLNFYEGCRDILFEGNYVQNVIPINRSAERITFRNNVVDSQHRNAISVAMWQSGKVGGTHIKDITFENNTFINSDTEANWYTAIFVQSGASRPEGLVARNNVLSRLRAPFPGVVEGNVYLHETDTNVAGTDSMVVSDPAELFIDPANGDYRRKPGGPMMNAGANVPAPPAKWSRK